MALQVDMADLDRDIRRTQRKLENLQERVQKKVLRKAVRAANAPLVKKLRQAVPRGERKRLSKTIGSSVITNKKTGAIEGQVGQDRKRAKSRNAVHIHLIEGGTRPHQIAGSFENDYGDIVTGTFNHPGSYGQLPVEKTERRNRRSTIEAFAKKAGEETDKEAAAVGASP